ncbi:SSU ribosomal protein S10p (S20e) [Mycoplasmopsis meleagridis]|uniref:Small ribosomal subunit protein uS10 n=1 Tax=Mycoplasmopsis meleagridis ATCC 25294 TaxID=1264554 RepID=A0A0F5H186_9BACT|nr:30S ribosomal protein S10 [Mycoplasmopsis meleagridis]KKB27044.1 SSU ribosomal protein S10p (S20e) [Mycoplasmopsis meleagridis ATCC 25294]OAD18437.1 SSU ribosomal protein S10p (S20e) [Mycoplasmopsis meleagridis]VEU77349.1 30S ribosomal protein S10 [Mycoplasmopsis meleagridis]
MSKLNIKVKSFENQLVDFATKKIVEIAKKENVQLSGPIPLPTKREVVTILRSVHVNKKSREQFESRTYQRLIVLINPTDKTIDQIKRFELPAGVEIQITQK